MNSVFSATAQVQVIAPVANNISGKQIHFDIQGGRAPLATSGNYDMNVQSTGAFTTQGSSIFLNDAGYWAYTKWDDVTGYIQTSASFIYGNGLYRLTFEQPGAGTFMLTVPGSAASQFGRFNFLN